MVKQIYENKVDATQLIQIKLPVHMPEIQNWADYEKVQGQIQFKDNYYNYVGVKMTKDTMYLVCIANSVKTRLVGANLIVAKNISDTPVGAKKGAESSVKKAATNIDYNIARCEYRFLTFRDLVELIPNPISSLLTDPYIESPGKPPNSLVG
ncbi:hypothetical protein FPZ43_02685 [Mucilaginibacter pallidiroseus]|uniref:Uncharacterized protein n=2 Tax=Mucilaginibacter pallidiroseus TaxID=2599295 RepID=A0A563UJ80_9SPHI|nr:hypothetical protein FPZ43_02685 [Mucilaginibacter pallidiroseus]